MKAFVTGGFGFLGSHLIERLLKDNIAVTVLDNRSTGQMPFIQHLLPQINFVQADLLDSNCLEDILPGHDIVYHLAANADIRRGLDDPSRDFTQNLLATQRLLEVMRKSNVKRIMLASTGAVYGNPAVIPIPEDCPFPVQNSFYGASKVAAEALLSAYCEGFGFQGYIFRFVPMIGERYSHGHIYDFYKKLHNNPNEIEIIGDGNQRKYSVYVGDAIDAVLLGIKLGKDKLNIFNVGNDKFYTINQSIDWICAELELSPWHFYTGMSWIGDNPDMHLNNSRIHSLGWSPQVSLHEGIIRTIRYLIENEWLLESRV